jgi:hypothetical protein
MNPTTAVIDRTRLTTLIRREQAAFAEGNPRSRALFPRPARRCLAAYQ